MREVPERVVLDFAREQPRSNLFVTAVTKAELRYGYRLLSAGKRRSDLRSATERVVQTEFPARVLPFDSDAAKWYGPLAAARGAATEHLDLPDIQIASIAVARGMTVVRRNVSDFEGMGIDVVNPWVDA